MNLVKNLRVGQRVRAIQINDPYTRIKSGECGTIHFIDDLETIHVNWDSGSILGIIPEIDEFEIIPYQSQTL
jgi:hypothetical protein